MGFDRLGLSGCSVCGIPQSPHVLSLSKHRHSAAPKP